jgi:hypothetical protein
MSFLFFVGLFPRPFHLIQAVPAMVSAIVLDDVGEKLSHMPASVALEQNAFRELIQLQHTSSGAPTG